MLEGVWSRVRDRLSVWIKVRSTAVQPKVEKEAQPEEVEFNARDFNPLPPESSAEEKSSEEIFAEIGAELRKRREMLSLTYQEIERHTRVRATFLDALEKGYLEDLPSPVQTRGILANYATFLDLDTDGILLRFADGLQARHRERLSERPGRSRSKMPVHETVPPLRTFIASDLVFGGGMAIMILLFAIWGVSRVITIQSSQQPQATAPSIPQVLAATELSTSQAVTVVPADTSSAPLDTTPTLELQTLAPNINVQIIVVAVERTYIRVTVDGKVSFEGRTDPGSSYPYEAEKQIDVLVGNAAAVKITYAGNDLGLMGNFGEVVDRVYTAQGMVTPTSTKPPTPTATSPVTPTPSETPTPTPTRTPTPKPGG